MDRIIIRDLLVRCIIGIHDEERREKQDVVINVSLMADLRKAGKSDRFEDTIDYSAIKRRILHDIQDSSYCLIEALAERVAELCLENQSVQEVQVTVDKPTALRFARSVAVEITRDRNV